MIHPGKMQGSMNDQEPEFVTEWHGPSARLLPDSRHGDYHVAQVAFLDASPGGEGQHIGDGILAAEARIQPPNPAAVGQDDGHFSGPTTGYLERGARRVDKVPAGRTAWDLPPDVDFWLHGAPDAGPAGSSCAGAASIDSSCSEG